MGAAALSRLERQAPATPENGPRMAFMSFYVDYAVKKSSPLLPSAQPVRLIRYWFLCTLVWIEGGGTGGRPCGGC